ncbi:AAA family ATPase [Paenibacillus sp. 1P07SE]|uniref:AAA family ATPase n=1 Tax=Paenibacillus sp. 1P07SE TaxID=3132209 RepID=UPI0039A722C2
MELAAIRDLADRIRTNVGRVIIGKDEVVDKLMIALITSGHVLLEDVPGTGKTLLAKAMAKSLACEFKRIQFTPDLLPTDLSGIQFYNQKTSEFEFRPGPLFSHLLLADEINRATPRTQSSLLECMEERQVSADGVTRALEQPFLVIATQNPVEHQGTFPLPEAQLDRFLFKVRMGYPTTEEGLDILKRFKSEQPLGTIQPVAAREELIQAQAAYSSVYAGDDLLRYLLELIERTRSHADVTVGVSPRGSQALLRAAQAHAILQGRDYVSPDDVKAMAVPVLAHRIVPASSVRSRPGAAEKLIDSLLSEVPVPAEEQV